MTSDRGLVIEANRYLSEHEIPVPTQPPLFSEVSR